MKIELQEPYSSDWKLGYLRVSSLDGRKRLDLFNSNTERTTTAFARYLMSVKLGRYLTEDEEADHIDNDATNDLIENLQVLSVEEHKAKTKSFIEGRTFKTCVCSYCGIEFEREVRQIKSDKTLCSRSCNAKYNREFGSWTGKLKKHTQEEVDKIVELRASGLSDYKISDIIGIHRSKIQRLRIEFGIK